MKVFIGWSGETSHNVALALHAWLPKVIQTVKPFVSSEDIAKGARWSSVIAKELEASKYGIICVTKENIDTAWINFEAGALSKEIDESLVSPFLFDMKASDVQGPLKQFQAVPYEKVEIRKLLSNINDRQAADLRLEKGNLDDAFETYWPLLEKKLKEIPDEPKGQGHQKPKSDQEILEELLAAVRLHGRYLDAFQQMNAESARRMTSEFASYIENLSARIDALGRSVESLHRPTPPAADLLATLSYPSGSISGPLPNPSQPLTSDQDMLNFIARLAKLSDAEQTRKKK